MQTFLPYRDFTASARSLDLKRLGKQRVENLQIMLTLLTGKTAEGEKRKGWPNHPAVKMWRGYEICLLKYQHAICSVWTSNVTQKGVHYVDTCYESTRLVVVENIPGRKLVEPFWLGDERVHTSHQSNLVRKKPEHYRPQFPDVPDDIEYFWPVA